MLLAYLILKTASGPVARSAPENVWVPGRIEMLPPNDFRVLPRLAPPEVKLEASTISLY